MELTLSANTKTQKHLLAEIDNMCAALAKLEDQVSGKVLSLIDKETQVSRLTLEKGKLDHKCATISKQLTTLQNSQSAGKKLLEKQLERLRGYEESERALQSQVTTLEKSLILENAGIRTYSNKVEALNVEIGEIKSVLNRVRQQLAQSQHIATERTNLVTRLGEEKRAAEEKVEAMKRRIDTLTQNAASGEQGGDMAEQINELKVYAVKFPMLPVTRVFSSARSVPSDSRVMFFCSACIPPGELAFFDSNFPQQQRMYR